MGTAFRLGKAHRYPGAGGPRGGTVSRANRQGSCHRVKLQPRILVDDEDEETPVASPDEVVSDRRQTSPVHWAWTLGLAAGAAVPRLLYLFVFSDPENPG